MQRVTIFFALAGLCSCGTATQPLGVALLEHDLFYEISTETTQLELINGEGHFSSSEISTELQPQLSRAFAIGELNTPLIGRDHANWVRDLKIIPGEKENQFVLTAKALAPYPVRLSLIHRAEKGDLLLSRSNSNAWNSGTHFAIVKSDFEMKNSATLIVRTEGAKQGVDNVVSVIVQ
ncbi:MAG: hypothetical protein QGF46_03305 [Planctomycetota bacterium]|jgi:hypothetical protein|nr:hypothetical protein [Planctomycetota bacterium]